MTKRECFLLGMLIGVVGRFLCVLTADYLGGVVRRARCAICSHTEVGPDRPLFVDIATGMTEVLDFSPSEDGGRSDDYLIVESEQETQITVLNPAQSAHFDTARGTGRFCDPHARQLAKRGIPYGVLFDNSNVVTFARAKLDEAYHYGDYYMDATMMGESLYIYVLWREE